MRKAEFATRGMIFFTVGGITLLLLASLTELWEISHQLDIAGKLGVMGISSILVAFYCFVLFMFFDDEEGS